MADQPNAKSLLTFYVDAGADESIGDKPVNRFEEVSKPPSKSDLPASIGAPNTLQQPGQQPDQQSDQRSNQRSGMPSPRAPARAAPAPLVSQSDVVRTAREAATACRTLDELRQSLAAFDGCALRETAMNLVFADGNPQADLMLLGEGPGAEEDRMGVPFVGPSGKLLDRMLAAIGRDRSSAYITNIVPWRPPGNRNPSTDEATACLPFTEQHIKLIQPRVLVLLGATAAGTILERSEGITRLRGHWYEYSKTDITIDAMPTFHPAYLLRQPAQKKRAWQDFLAIKARLNSK